jgi:hypothetical protein
MRLTYTALGLLLASLNLAQSQTNTPASGKVRSKRDFSEIKHTVETLRGKRFTNDVPVFHVSDKQLRDIAVRELDRDYPGPKLRSYEQLLAWLGMIPAGTDLKAVYGDFLVGQVAGLYDSDTREMSIPAAPAASAAPGTQATGKKLTEISSDIDDIVLAHEFTHALEDQYWPLDVPADHDQTSSTDQGTAHSFVAEGSATRHMIEAIPAEFAGGSPGFHFLLWNLIHSTFGEWVLRSALNEAWKSPDVLVDGVPDSICRTESMPYSFGYLFCTKAMRDWGLDGLDYICDHPPVSSEQVMHPAKYWAWRDFPARINLPETLAGGWTQTSLECLGEAGIAALFGCSFTNLNRGLEIARGWDGDHAALFEGPSGHHLLLWASSWDSTNAAGRFVSAWLTQCQLPHHAEITGRIGNRTDWTCPDGRAGFILRDRRRVILLETDDPSAKPNTESCAREITFVDPPEDAIRSAANSFGRRFNPIWSWQKDGDYTITRSLCGLVSRHDRTSFGDANTYLLGMLGETRRTASFKKWQLGAGFVARHESEARRGSTKTTWLPWGVLASYSAARLPESPDKTIMRQTILWGVGENASLDGSGRRKVEILPFGILYHHLSSPRQASTHILATGFSRKEALNHGGTTSQFRVLGIPVWTHRSP